MTSVGLHAEHRQNQTLSPRLQRAVRLLQMSSQEIARIREKLQPVIAKYTPQVGEPLVNELNAELAKMRGGKR